MKHLLKLFFLFALTTVFFACNKKDDPQPNGGNNNNNNPGGPEGTRPAFLKAGTVYEYDYSDFFSDGTITTTIESELATDTFLVRNASDMSYIAPTQYYVIKEGVLSTSFRLRDPSTYYVLCKFGVPAGTSWNVTQNGTSYTYSIEAVDQTLLTGFGSVTDVIKVKIVNNSTTSVSYNYYSPTVGVLGTSAFGSEEGMQLKTYTAGTTASNPPSSYLPTFGSFPFMQVGKYWRNAYEDISGGMDTLKLEIISKLASPAIYTVKMTWESSNEVSYEYWFEDHGLLMVYEQGETWRQADPIYSASATAEIGHGWAGKTKSGTNFVYKISSLNSNIPTTAFGTLSCMGIEVSQSIFSSQTNYWNNDKGNVSVSGLLMMDVVSSNARKNGTSAPHIPGFTF